MRGIHEMGKDWLLVIWCLYSIHNLCLLIEIQTSVSCFYFENMTSSNIKVTKDWERAWSFGLERAEKNESLRDQVSAFENGSTPGIPWCTRIWCKAASTFISTATWISSTNYHHHNRTTADSCFRWHDVSWEPCCDDLPFLPSQYCNGHSVHKWYLDMDSLWWRCIDGVRL